jgi:hypothetical protein
MADMHEVIQLAAILDDRIVERSAVDRRIGADLDIVADQHPSDLRNLDPILTIRRKPETIAPITAPAWMMQR